MLKEIDWKKEYIKLNEYRVALENTRTDLWGMNEDLRNKALSLERGQEDLLSKINDLQNRIDLLVGVSVVSESLSENNFEAASV